ncbi:lipoyl(octanoyl) transferase LipB [Candidatus Omnitrophota bacterium]
MIQSLLTQPYQRGSSKLRGNHIPCKVIDLGFIDYLASLEIQQNTLKHIKHKESVDSLFFCEHPSTITVGRTAKKDSVLIPETELRRSDIRKYDVDRGGDVTYHGPGQLVVYPVFDLSNYKKDLRWYLNNLEDVIIEVLGFFGIGGVREESLRGVWVSGKKIASIGIAVRNWITYHGLALNVAADLRYFSYIKPCGLDVTMTSMEQLIKRKIDTTLIKQVFIDVLAKKFNLSIIREGRSDDRG